MNKTKERVPVKMEKTTRKIKSEDFEELLTKIQDSIRKTFPQEDTSLQNTLACFVADISAPIGVVCLEWYDKMINESVNVTNKNIER